ncbi:MAG: hypothetical protein N2Z85_00520 [Patescibacteria group bacterium]|nr:hypothetical protein [Patescibacteria group bacterium]
MSEKFKNILKLILIVVILVLILILIVNYFNKNKISKNINQIKQIENKNNNDLNDIKVIEKDSVVEDKKIAKPESVLPASTVSDSSIRSFKTIIANQNEFSPQIITAYKNDIIDFYIQAIDKDYDFFQPDYGYTLKISKGETKRVQFQVTAEGKFMFYCKSCGGPDKGPIGYIIVKSK